MWYSYYVTCNSGATAIAFKLGGRAITLPVHSCSQGGQTTCITLKHLHQGVEVSHYLREHQGSIITLHTCNLGGTVITYMYIRGLHFYFTYMTS